MSDNSKSGNSGKSGSSINNANNAARKAGKSSKVSKVSHLSNFISGRWLPGSGCELVTIDPATGLRSWASLESTAADVDLACRAASRAFEPWAGLAFAQRDLRAFSRLAAG
jgi:hypothetical protein